MRVDFDIVAYRHPCTIEDLRIDVVLQHTNVHGTTNADETSGNRTHKRDSPCLVRGTDIDVLFRRSLIVCIGLVYICIADPRTRVGVDDTDADCARYADKSEAGGDDHIDNLFA